MEKISSKRKKAFLSQGLYHPLTDFVVSLCKKKGCVDEITLWGAIIGDFIGFTSAQSSYIRVTRETLLFIEATGYLRRDAEGWFRLPSDPYFSDKERK